MADSKIKFSPFIIGTMRFGIWGANLDTHAVEKLIDQCIDLGLRDFDHADIYGHYTEEENFGRVLKRRPDLKNKIRLTTKCGIKLTSENRPSHTIKSYDSTKAHILFSVDHSLKALSVECIDFLLIHRPDFLMDAAEIAEAFEKLKNAGKVKAFGVSNFTTAQFNLLNSVTPLVTNQVEVSLLHLNAFQDGTLDQCQQLKIHPTAWSPFGGGEIFSSNSTSDQVLRIQKVANEIGARYNATIDQILLAWILKHPAGIIPILGSSKISRIEHALNAQNITLSHEEWYQLWQASTGEEIP